MYKGMEEVPSYPTAARADLDSAPRHNNQYLLHVLNQGPRIRRSVNRRLETHIGGTRHSVGRFSLQGLCVSI